MTEARGAGAPARTIEDAMPRIAGHIARMRPGPAAELRRTRRDPSTCAAFWQLMAKYNPLGNERNTAGWAAVVQAVALLTPTGVGPDKKPAHEARVPLGLALERAGMSEAALARMLATRNGRRRDAAGRMCRRLIRTGHNRTNTITLARFVLYQDEQTDAEIARAYYRAAHETARKKEAKG